MLPCWRQTVSKHPFLLVDIATEVFCHELLRNERFQVLASTELTSVMCCLKKPRVIKSSVTTAVEPVLMRQTEQPPQMNV